MFPAIERLPKFDCVGFCECAGKMEDAAFPGNMAEIFPYRIHTVLADNGTACADVLRNREEPSRRFPGAGGKPR
ncbi:hypothetical protein BG36_19140 [Aquamicrobium defluvii]|uniref:Uncharacterized protein n=1 Tax=Aquamicrobium defluvii TaxID=69279 RepID=A0A011SQN3_9HYPH|nr:hypothetical protein BG36_19140 [Aquamicrobium defluvii]TDR30942.1 hypothetical protein DES43_1389 [Aquamicrobium defluvii]